jgi:hypothetical protein
MRRWYPLLLLAILPLPASADQAPADSHPLHLNLANAGTGTIHCRLMFGHWVERDLGLLPAGASVGLDIRQAEKDGALYIMRADGQRRMMIETILCGLDGDWMASYGEVDFAPARSARPTRIEARCAVPAAGGRVTCSAILLAP